MASGIPYSWHLFKNIPIRSLSLAAAKAAFVVGRKVFFEKSIFLSGGNTQSINLKQKIYIIRALEKGEYLMIIRNIFC